MNEKDKRLVKRATRLLGLINATSVNIELKTPQSTYSIELAKEFQQQLKVSRIKNKINIK